MKFDFTYYNPTKIHFGKNAIDNLEKEKEEKEFWWNREN